MNKHISKNTQKNRKDRKAPWGPTRLAGRLSLVGLPLLLLGLCDVAARLCDGLRAGSVGLIYTMAYDIECLAAGAAILLGGALLLDYLERRAAHDSRK